MPHIGAITTPAMAASATPSANTNSRSRTRLMPERTNHFTIVRPCLDDGAVGRLFQEQPQEPDGDRRERARKQAIFRVDEVAQHERARNGVRKRQLLLGGAEHGADALLDDERCAKGQQKAVQRVASVRAPQRELEQHAEYAHCYGREHERYRIAPTHRQRTIVGQQR